MTIDETQTITSDQDGAVDTAPETEGGTLVTQEFEDLLENAISEPGDVTEENEDVLAVRVHYNTLDRKGKAGARSFIEEKAQAEVMAGNLPFAQALFVVRRLIVEPIPVERKPSASPRRRNRTDATAASIAAIQIAYSLAMLSAHSDTGLDADWQDKIAALATTEAQERAQVYATWLKEKQDGPEPEASEVEKAAARISLGRSPKGQGRKPRDGVEIGVGNETENTPPSVVGAGESVVETGEVDPVAAAAFAEL